MAYEEEDSGIGLGKVAAGIGALGAAVVFRRNIGKFAKNYYNNFVKETDPNPDPVVPKFKKEVQPKKERLPEPAAADQSLSDKDAQFSLQVRQATGGPLTPQDKARQVIIEQKKADTKFLNQQKELIKKKPLTLGGAAEDNDMYGIGSVLYDYLVYNTKDAGPQTVEHWKKIFSGKLKHDYVALNRRVNATITKQEIADTNIARFDENGNLIDGYLKYIEDMNRGSKKPIKISPTTLLKLIRNAPANNLITMEYNSANFAEEGGRLAQTAYDITKKILLADKGIQGNFFVDNSALSAVLKIARYDNRNIPKANFRYANLDQIFNQAIMGKNYYANAGSFGSKMQARVDGRTQLSVDDSDAMLPLDNVATPALALTAKLKTFKNAIRDESVKSIENDKIIKFFDSPATALGKGFEGTDPNITVGDVIDQTHAASLRFNRRMSSFQKAKNGTPPGNMDEPVSSYFNLLETRGPDGKMKSVSPFNEYPELSAYRTYGPENFFETVILINPKIYKKVQDQIPSFNLNPVLDNIKHFNRALPTGEIMDAQMLHIRGGIRAVHPTFGGKTLSVDELQDDIGQSIQKQIKADQIQDAANRFKAEENRRRIEEGIEPIDDEWVRQKFLASRTRENVDANFKESGRLLNADNPKDAKLMKEPLIPDSEIVRLYSTPAMDLPNPTEFMFDEAKKLSLQRNLFNLDDINANMYRDRLLTVAEEMDDIAKLAEQMTPQDVKKYNELKNQFFDIQKIIPDVSKVKQSKYTYKPMDGRETWGPLGLKYAIKKAAREGIDWVSINPYEVTHHREGRRLGNLEFYGNAFGTGELFKSRSGLVLQKKQQRELAQIFSKQEDAGDDPVTQLTGFRTALDLVKGKLETEPAKFVGNMNSSAKTRYRDTRSNRVANNPTATLPAFLRTFAKEYGTEVKTIKVAKSDPKRRVKFIKETRSINPNTGEEVVFEEHIGAMTLEEYEVYKTKKASFSGGFGDDLNNAKVEIRGPGEINPKDYYDSYAIKVKPEFKDVPIRGYKKGGLAVNPFKW